MTVEIKTNKNMQLIIKPNEKRYAFVPNVAHQSTIPFLPSGCFFCVCLLLNFQPTFKKLHKHICGGLRKAQKVDSTTHLWSWSLSRNDLYS